MPRRAMLSVTERKELVALPDSKQAFIQFYTFNETDLALIKQRRRAENRLGIAVQLCLLRYPGRPLQNDSELPKPFLQWVAKQIDVDVNIWPQYAAR